MSTASASTASASEVVSREVAGEKAGEEVVSLRGARARAFKTLRGWIEDGTLAHGHPLPGERELATGLGVNRNTLRAALSILDDEGLLRSNGGRLRMIHKPALHGAGVLEHTIAVLAPDEGLMSPLRRGSGWAEQITQGALSCLSAQGLHALVLHPDRVQKADLARILDSQPFGVVITELFSQPEHLREILKWLRAARVPCAVYGDGAALAAHDRVVSDHEGGAFQATHWLAEQGRKRILTLWDAPAGGYWLAQRRAGYERAMREAGLEPLPTVVAPLSTLDFSNHDNIEGKARLLCGHLVEFLSGPEPIDAIVLASDGMTRIVQVALGLFKLRAGQDVLLAGYDNYWAEIQDSPFDPSIPQVTVDKRNWNIGQALIELLIERVEGSLPDEPQRHLVKPRLSILVSETSV